MIYTFPNLTSFNCNICNARVQLTYRSSGRVRVVFPDCGRTDDDHGLGSNDVPRLFGHAIRDTRLANHRVEAVHRVGRIVDCTHSAIGFHQTVLPPDHVTGPLLRLMFDVTRGRVVNAVLIRVAGRHLYNNSASDTLTDN